MKTISTDTAVLRQSLKAVADIWQEWRGVVKSCRVCGASADKGDAIIHRGNCIVPMAIAVTSAQDWA